MWALYQQLSVILTLSIFCPPPPNHHPLLLPEGVQPRYSALVATCTPVHHENARECLQNVHRYVRGRSELNASSELLSITYICYRWHCTLRNDAAFLSRRGNLLHNTIAERLRPASWLGKSFCSRPPCTAGHPILRTHVFKQRKTLKIWSFYDYEAFIFIQRRSLKQYKLLFNLVALQKYKTLRVVHVSLN